MDSIRDVIVIGGGAAGMIAAWRAASVNSNVLLLEKNKRLGIKILISGGGKCNITNGNDLQTMLKQFEKQESRFLKFAFHTFTNTQLLSLLQQQGVETYVRENGKVFPVSHDAKEVVDAFTKLMASTGVEIQCNSPVEEISKEQSYFKVKTPAQTLFSRNVIVATGGLSYKKTGTTGDGYEWAKQFGHTIVPLRPALAPLYLSPVPSVHWQGTPIRDCTLYAVCEDGIVAQWHGDVLFTHFGISGPSALEVSKKAFAAMQSGKQVSMHVDFFPELRQEQLESKLISDISENTNKHITTFIEQYVPKRLAEYIVSQAHIDGTTKLYQLKKEERKRLTSVLKSCFVGIVSEIPLDRGEVTAGGVALHEINPTTMESKLVKGLFFCGEILDIAGPVGGYNLQAAFSTGYVAGESAGKNQTQHAGKSC